jgi:molybdate transport system ATP-binding protein
VSVHAKVERRLGALDLSVELGVEGGEVLALLGPNGTGKSTVLRCLAGLLDLDGGRIEIDGVVVDDPDTGVFVPPERRSVGFVFQDYLLFAHMSVLENVAYGLRARRVRKAPARQAAAEWLDRVELGRFAHARPSTLSGGQAQRVALARALAPQPRLLLLDEPLAALDAGTRASMRRDLARHLDRFDGMTVLVTHDPVDAFALADRVAIIEHGRIAQVGTLGEVTAHPRSRYVADLVGVNLVAGTVEAGVLTTPSGAAVMIADAPPGASFAVIRPHSIALATAPVERSSARNGWTGTVEGIDLLGDRARVVLDGELRLVAEVTAAAVTALELRAGDTVHASVKATDIEVYPA